MTESDEPAFSLQAGIVAGQFDDQVRSATANLRQGTLVAASPMLYAADPEHPIYAATRAWAGTGRAASGAVNITNPGRRPPWGVIVTQTCDVVEEGARPKRPWVHVAPVYPLACDRGTRRMIERERGFDYLCPVTALTGDDDQLWVADLRLLIPVEKGWLVGARTTDGFADEDGRDRLARQLARLFARPAYATELGHKVLSPLSQLLREIAERYDGADPVIAVGLSLGRNRMNPSNAQVVFILDGEPSGDLHEQILNWGRARIEDPPEGICLLLPRIVQVDDLSAREYRALELIDVTAFSPADDPQPLTDGSSSGAASADR